MSGTTVKRRRFLSEPGVEPLLTLEPIAYIENFEAFVEATGIDPERLLATPVVRFPLPVAVKDQDGKIARWKGIDPSMLWLPLFWLPPHLALRYQYRVIDEETGGTSDDLEIESDETWAARVMLELCYAGLYDPASGTWGDVLSFYGLDIDNPVDQARVEVWLEGQPDEILDSIDLTSHIVHEADPEWALHAARQLMDTCVPAQWSLSASGILAAIGRHLAYTGDTDTDRRDILKALGSVAANALRSIPEDETGFTPAEVIEAFIAEAHNPDQDSRELLEGFMQVLSEVSEGFSPWVDAISGSVVSAPAA